MFNLFPTAANAREAGFSDAEIQSALEAMEAAKYADPEDAEVLTVSHDSERIKFLRRQTKAINILARME